MNDIFVSYAREDTKFAETLAKAFEQEGWTVWWDRSLLAGDAFERVIRENLDDARCVIVLWSKHSIASDWVRGEARLGHLRGVLVPVLIDEKVNDIDIPIEFQGLHTERIGRWKGGTQNNAYRRLADAVARTGARPSAARTTVGTGSSRKTAAAVTLAVIVLLGLGALWWTGRVDHRGVANAGTSGTAGADRVVWDVSFPDTTHVGESIDIAISPQRSDPGMAPIPGTDVTVRVLGANAATLPTTANGRMHVATYNAANAGVDTLTVFVQRRPVHVGLIVIRARDRTATEVDGSATSTRPRNGAIVLNTRSPATVYLDGRRVGDVHGQDTVSIPAGRPVAIRLVWTIDANRDGRPDCTPWDSTVTVRGGATVNRGRPFFQCNE